MSCKELHKKNMSGARLEPKLVLFSIYSSFVVHFESGEIWNCPTPVKKDANKEE